MNTPFVLVTGANGFIGQALIPQLISAGLRVRAQARGPQPARPGVETIVLDLAGLAGRSPADDESTWSAALEGVHSIIHLAGIAHRSHGGDADLHDRINHRATARLARLAVRAGVRRFVLVSSVNAVGTMTASRAGTTAASTLTPSSTPEPTDDYGRSKLAAERSVIDACAASAMQWCVVRPPLVYGAGAKANLHRLMEWVLAGRPVPAIRPPNARAMIGLPNLTDLLLLTITRDDLAGRILMPHDVHWSGAELAQAIARADAGRAWLLPMPAGLLTLIGRFTGQVAAAGRLTQSLRIDDPWLRDSARFRPSHPPSEVVAGMVTHFRAHAGAGR